MSEKKDKMSIWVLDLSVFSNCVLNSHMFYSFLHLDLMRELKSILERKPFPDVETEMQKMPNTCSRRTVEPKSKRITIRAIMINCMVHTCFVIDTTW